MSTTTMIGIGIFLLLMLLVFLGIPIWVSMITSSFLGFLILGGINMVTIQFKQAPFSLGANYTYAVLPLFMLVGTLAGETGIARGAFDSMQKWLGGIRGGLLYALVGANAVFGACSGISTAGNVVFGKIAMPELQKHNYDRTLALGSIVGAGALSSLIPPSVPIILFCLMTDLSIGTTLMYGLSLGIIMIILLCLCIKIIITIKPSLVPGKETCEGVSLKEKLISLKYLIPFVLVFGLIVGGTLAGLFPSTVAGAVAAVALVIYALVKGVKPKRIMHCIWDAAVMNAGIFPIIIAGTIFSRFISMTRMADGLANLIADLSLPSILIFTLVIIFYIICGCVMDIASIIIITVPIVFPLLTGLGYNPFALCVVLVMLCDSAGMTPPIGMNVFAVANALRTGTTQIFKGVIPFFIVDIVAIYIIALFPQLVEFIPHLLGY